MIRGVSLLTRRPEPSHAECVDHWENVHEPVAIEVPGIRRNWQSHITDEHFRSDIPPQEDEIDGIAELCYDSMENLERSSGSPEAEALYADGALIIGKIRTFTVEEKR